MDKAILGLTIVMMFSVAHERALEFARGFAERLPERAAGLRNVVNALTAGPFATSSGVLLALLTNANLFEAFRYNDKDEVLFFSTYLNGFEMSGYRVVGCVAMGLAVSLGSQWWHDFVKSLVDLRASLQAVRPTPEKLLHEAIVPLPPKALFGRQGLH